MLITLSLLSYGRKSLCTRYTVSERFYNSQNENDVNYKYFHSMTFSVFVGGPGLCWVYENARASDTVVT